MNKTPIDDFVAWKQAVNTLQAEVYQLEEQLIDAREDLADFRTKMEKAKLRAAAFLNEILGGTPQ